jgi:hypothetical protein
MLKKVRRVRKCYMRAPTNLHSPRNYSPVVDRDLSSVDAFHGDNTLLLRPDFIRNAKKRYLEIESCTPRIIDPHDIQY